MNLRCVKLNCACKSCGRSRVARVEPCHWSEGYVGVSLQERLATMQVMLGVSLRARWDATLVDITKGICFHEESYFWDPIYIYITDGTVTLTVSLTRQSTDIVNNKDNANGSPES